MKSPDIGRIAAWLDTIESHTIYDIKILTELRAYNIEVEYQGHGTWTLVKDGDEKAVTAYGHTREQIVKAISDRGLGGDLAADDYVGQRYISGHEISTVTAILLLGKDPGDIYSGRGSAHRTRREAIHALAVA